MSEPSTVLIVDDSELDRNTLSAVLKIKGYQVSSLASAEDCEAKIKEIQPDILLLDVLMPGINGNDLLTTLRTHYSSVELPILMITSKSDSSDIVETLGLGANDYITKPIDFDVTVMRINTHLKISELSKKIGHLRELEAVNAMVATYHHEINNPLAIALGALTSFDEWKDQESYNQIKQALLRIATILKQIKEVNAEEAVNFTPYAKSSKMVKL